MNTGVRANKPGASLCSLAEASKCYIFDEALPRVQGGTRLSPCWPSFLGAMNERRHGLTVIEGVSALGVVHLREALPRVHGGTRLSPGRRS